MTAAEVIAGDCLRVLRAMPPDAVDAVVTDPPWNLGKRYGAHDDAMPRDRYVEWLGDVLAECRRVSRGPVVLLPGACNGRWHRALLRRARLHPVVGLVWRKPAAEPILWTVVPPPRQLPATISAREPVPHHPALARHPCPKPLALFERLVREAVARGGTVLDPFAGTGTTLVAAVRHQRRAVGIELEPRYCRVAERRVAGRQRGVSYEWAEHTGELELHVRAVDEPGVFVEGLRALGELLGDGHDAPLETFEVTAAGDGRAALFAAWLEELTYRAESEGLVPVAVDRMDLEQARVAATARGYRGAPPHLVKAVTYHRLAFDRCDEGWCAVAVLDV